MDDQQFITTADGLAKIQTELKHLKDIERPDILQRIKEAKDLGDLSENADYQDAKEQQAFIEGRIMELEDLVKRAEVVEPTASGLVEIGKSVTVDGPGGVKVLQIVGPTDANPSTGLISHESPLGKAFLGHKCGEEVNVVTPSGESAYKIIKIG